MKILNEPIIDLEKIDLDLYYGYIYITQNIKSNKYYIGKKKIHTKSNHIKYLGSGKILKQAIKKYGKANFKKFIIALSTSEKELCELEKNYIDKYNATKDEQFYNIHIGGDGGYTMMGYTDEQKNKYSKRMSMIVKERYKDKNYKEMIKQKTMDAFKDGDALKRRGMAIKKAYQNAEVKKRFLIGTNKAWDNQERRELARQRINKRYEQDDTFKQMLSELWKGDKNPKSKGLSQEEIKKLAESRRVLRKQIDMCDDNWNNIKHFDGLQEALEYLNIKGHTALNKAIKEKTKYKGCYWRVYYKKSVETIETTSA